LGEVHTLQFKEANFIMLSDGENSTNKSIMKRKPTLTSQNNQGETNDEVGHV